LPKPKPKLAAQALFEFAVKSLGARAQSTAEITAKLRLRAAVAGDVDEAIARLKEYGYLDDKRFAESLANSRLENGLGKIRTLHDLRSRKVAGSIGQAAVENTYKETDEENLVEEYIRRKFRTVPKEQLFQEDKDLASAYRRLLRAGFRGAVIVRVLKRFAKNPDLLDFVETDGPAEES
jgi:regulatory protein